MKYQLDTCIYNQDRYGMDDQRIDGLLFCTGTYTLKTKAEGYIETITIRKIHVSNFNSSYSNLL